ncbi:hypothetical protein GCM10029992_22850 [Glycomyces albus]
MTAVLQAGRSDPGRADSTPAPPASTLADIPAIARVRFTDARTNSSQEAVLSRRGEVWTLLRGDEVIGRITVDRSDFPWLEGAFEALPGFAEFKPLFDRELELIEADLPEQVPDWEELYTEIQRRLSLHDPDGPVEEFLLHVEDGRAWFRWIDAHSD